MIYKNYSKIEYTLSNVQLSILFYLNLQGFRGCLRNMDEIQFNGILHSELIDVMLDLVSINWKANELNILNASFQNKKANPIVDPLEMTTIL